MRGDFLRNTGRRLEDLPFRDILDITLAYLVNEGGGDPNIRNAMRTWANTGKFGDDHEIKTVEPQTPPERVRNIKVAENVLVSQATLDAFSEMGGVIGRQPRRRRTKVESDGR